MISHRASWFLSSNPGTHKRQTNNGLDSCCHDGDGRFGTRYGRVCSCSRPAGGSANTFLCDKTIQAKGRAAFQRAVKPVNAMVMQAPSASPGESRVARVVRSQRGLTLAQGGCNGSRGMAASGTRRSSRRSSSSLLHHRPRPHHADSLDQLALLSIYPDTFLIAVALA